MENKCSMVRITGVQTEKTEKKGRACGTWKILEEVKVETTLK